MDLSSLAQMSQILGGGAVVAAVVFGIAQIRQLRQQRRDTAAVELMPSLQDHEFTRGLPLIFAWSEALPAADLRAKGGEYEEAAFAVSTRLGTIGLLVFRGSIPFFLVEDLVGGVTVALWRRLQPWVEDLRGDQDHKQLWEWLQWLAERLDERERTKMVPAHERYRAWTPKR